MVKQKVILFFILDHAPTKAELKFAQTLQGSVRFRNAQYLVKGAALEKADAVTGAAPSGYKDSGVEVIAFDGVTPGDGVNSKDLKKDQLIAALTDAGVELPAGLKVDELRELYDKQFSGESEGGGNLL